MTAGLTVPIIGMGVATTKMAIDFETSFAQVSTLLDEGSTDIDKYKSDILTASSEMGVGVGEYSESVYQAISAGVDQAEAISFVKTQAKLAKGGFTDLTTAVDVTTTVLNAYGLETENATKINDLLIATQNKGKTTVAELGSSLSQVIPTAAALGVDFEQVGTSLAIMTAQGIPTAQATTSLNGMLAELGKQGTNANNSMIKASEGTEMAGMSFAEMSEKGFSLGDILNNMKSYADDNNMSLIDMFGSIEAGKGALAITSDGEAFNTTLESMKTQAGSTDEAFGKMSDTAEFRLTQSMNELKNAGILLGEALLPVIDNISVAISNLATWFSSLSEGQQKTVLIVLALLAALGPLAMIIGAITTILPVLGAAFAFITGPIGLIILGIVAVIAIILLLKKHWGAVVSFMKNAFSTVGRVILNVLKGIGNTFIGIINTIIKAINFMIKASLAPLNAIIKGLNKIPGVNIKKIKLSIPKIPKLKIGTDLVKQDGLAYLHKNESVQPASVAGGGYSGGYNSGNANITMQVPDIYLDGNKVSRVVTPYITKTVKLSGGNV